MRLRSYSFALIDTKGSFVTTLYKRKVQTYRSTPFATKTSPLTSVKAVLNPSDKNNMQTETAITCMYIWKTPWFALLDGNKAFGITCGLV